MNAEQLLKTYISRATVKVTAPELPEVEHLHVRCLTMGEMRRLQGMDEDKTASTSIALALAGHDGERMFPDDNLEAGVVWVEKLPANLIMRLTQAIESLMDEGKAKN